MRVVIEKAGGIQTIQVGERTTHLDIDARTLQRSAIGDFLQKVIGAENSKTISKDELIGAALGYFGVELTHFYPDIKDRYDLNDAALASMVRWAHRRDLADAEEQGKPKDDEEALRLLREKLQGGPEMFWGKTISDWAIDCDGGTIAWHNLCHEVEQGNPAASEMKNLAEEKWREMR